MSNNSKKYQPLGVGAIAYIATLYTQHRLTDALECLEICGLHGESALAPFGIIEEVA
ncbi:hypothetical protein [Coleofasciculus sp.]|uniref:hypothetical protein n=1 Tax=Coleofasciculus sp. TaxID=3100458 RepID=UPI0039F88FE4